MPPGIANAMLTRSMYEMMQATWRHQSIVDGKSENFYRQSRAQRVVPLGNGQAGVSNILRA